MKRNKPWTCPRCNRTMKEGGKGPHLVTCGHDPKERFWSWVNKGEGCWLWKGAKHRDGYGRANVRLEGKSRIRIAHRIAWLFTYGPIPSDKDVCHTCDVPLCCRPEHLYLGTHQDNMLDMQRKERRRSNQLTAAQVREIRALLPIWKFGMGKDIARKYGVSEVVISKLKIGDTYRFFYDKQCGDGGLK